jgi:gliding motility-associated-like protein
LCNSNTINIKNQSNISDIQSNGFQWSVGNLTQSNSDYSDFNTAITEKTFPSSFTVKLKAIYGSNITCSTEVSKTNYIRFIKPIAKFEILNDSLIKTCPPYTLQLQNLSTGYKDLTWVFNDTTTNTTTLDTLLYSVSKPNSYTISLRLNGYDNCYDSTTYRFKAIGPIGTMSSDAYRGCMPLVTNFTVNSNDSIVNYLWNLDNGNSYNQVSPNYFNYTYNSGGTFNPTVTILGRPEDGSCTNVLSLDSSIIVDSRINLAYQPNYTFCLGDTSTSSGVKIEVTHQAPTILEWTSDPSENINTLSSTTDSIVYAKPLSTTIYDIHATSLNSCPDEDGKITVTTRESPILTFPTKTITVAAGEYYYLNPQVTDTSNFLSYHWTPEFRLSNAYILNPQAISDIDTTYYLNVQNQYGCSTSDSINVKVLCSQSKILMASGFTPNGDGKNDRFYVSGYGIKNVKHFVIFDRWGKKVFERNGVSANDFNQGWDGTSNGKQSEPGTYMYIADLTCSEGTDYTVKGSIVLIR